jgi:Leucine-rich repeat (LRR) protein
VSLLPYPRVFLDLKALPVELDKMKNLEILDISDNIIETLPERICKMPALKKLDCSDNKITKGFPSSDAKTSI